MVGAKKSAFTKGYKAKWSEELFKIVEIHYGTYVPMYSVADKYKTRLPKRFYENEINFVKRIT